jgi:endonuclease III
MKDSKEYSKKVGKLYRLMKANRSKVKKVAYDRVADALVYAIVSENMSDSSAEAAIKRFEDYFVDLNDLRVSRVEEIIEVLGEDTPVTRDTASRLNRTLRAVFNEYNSVSLESLKKMGKRPAKQALETIDGSSRFMVNYCMLTSLHGHAIPLTQQMIEYLRNNELVHPEADEHEIEGFLSKRISSASAYEFYVLLRSESESPKLKLEKKTTHKTKTTTARKRKK